MEGPAGSFLAATAPTLKGGICTQQICTPTLKHRTVRVGTPGTVVSVTHPDGYYHYGSQIAPEAHRVFLCWKYDAIFTYFQIYAASS